MNQKALLWAQHDKNELPGTFRVKDLNLFFMECCEKYSKLLELNRKKEQLITNFQSCQPPAYQPTSRFTSDSQKKRTGQNKVKHSSKGYSEMSNRQIYHSSFFKRGNDRGQRTSEQVLEDQ